MSGAYAWFVASLAGWTIAVGMQQVLFAWLVAGELRAGPEWVGTAQTCQMVPSLLFLLVGGVTADRFDRRRLLLALHATAALVVATVAVAVASGALSLALVLAFAIAWGTLSTFAQPARDSLLSDVAGEDLMRAVSGATLAHFAGQALGSYLAGIGAWLGSATALGLQAAFLLLSLLLVWQLPRAPVSAAPRSRGATLAAIREGFRTVSQSSILRPVALLVAADGLFFMGPFLVFCPLMVRDLYRGGIGDLSIAMMIFTLGTITGSLVVLGRGGVRRKGRAFLLALFGVASCLVSMAAQPPFWGFCAALFFWGVSHSFFFNTSRTIFQRTAPATHRARVLSVHSLGLLGMAPLSNLGAGLLATRVEPATGCAVGGGAMLVLTALAWRFTALRRLE